MTFLCWYFKKGVGGLRKEKCGGGGQKKYLNLIDKNLDLNFFSKIRKNNFSKEINDEYN